MPTWIRRFEFWGAVASVLALIVVLFVKDEHREAMLALGFVVLIASITAFALCLNAFMYLRKAAPTGFSQIASFVRYQADSAGLVNYEVYKVVQARRPWLGEYEHKFFWTGSADPQISSALQDVGKLVKQAPDEDTIVYLRFKRPLRYNEAAVVHARFEMDDHDHKSEPVVQIKVEMPTDVLRWTVELTDETDRPPAELRKARTGSSHTIWQHCRNIPFNKTTHSYEHYEHGPDVGYTYQLRWDRT